jgi:hypothetical protein
MGNPVKKGFWKRLFDEIDQDPATKGYKTVNDEWKPSAVIHSLLHGDEENFPLVPASTLLSWSAARGVLGSIHDDSEDASSDTRDISMAAMVLITNPSFMLDTTNPEIDGMLTALKNGGLITNADITNLKNRVKETLSRAILANVRNATVGHINQVRELYEVDGSASASAS